MRASEPIPNMENKSKIPEETGYSEDECLDTDEQDDPDVLEDEIKASSKEQ